MLPANGFLIEMSKFLALANIYSLRSIFMDRGEREERKEDIEN